MNKTALIYSEQYLKHNAGKFHPERPERLSETIKYLKESGLMDKLGLTEPHAASLEDVERVHTPHYVEMIRYYSNGGGYRITEDTYVSKTTFEIALLAAGGVITAGDVVLEGSYDNSYALVRPPGHHAKASEAAGFCYFNNVAVAVRFLQHKYKLKKIMIFDWDIHTADGTMSIFWRDPTVLNISIHQNPRTIYPGTGFIKQLGEGPGEGYTVNIPVCSGSGDKDYKYIIEEFVTPLAESYKPELIIISSGMDSHKNDPLGSINLTEKGYSVMSELFMELADRLCEGRIFVESEGGYDLDALSKSTYEVLKSLLGEPSGYVIGGELMEETRKLVLELADSFSRYHKI
ncbi:MAG: histone deacetylase [Candidatus Altiarchaeales archaeon ex4484_96]|nr:MAG: histone deacetylase [Candidatus Altiarchaeales archaeon ex4484_96]